MRECILYLNVYYYVLVRKRAILSVQLKNLKTMHHSSKSHLFPQFLRSPFYLPSLSPIASFFIRSTLSIHPPLGSEVNLDRTTYLVEIVYVPTKSVCFVLHNELKRRGRKVVVVCFLFYRVGLFLFFFFLGELRKKF